MMTIPSYKLKHRLPKLRMTKLFNTDTTVMQHTICRDCMGNWPLSYPGGGGGDVDVSI